MIQFAGSYKVDSWMEKDAKRWNVPALKKSADKHIGILDGHDIELEFSAKGPTEAELKDTFKVEGYYQKPGAERAENYRVERRMPLNIFSPIPAAIGMIFGLFMFDKNLIGFSSKGFNPKNYTTERLDHFVKRAFTTIKDQIENGKPAA